MKEEKFEKIILIGVIMIGILGVLAGCTKGSEEARFLTVKEGRLVNGRNETVILRGVNLGGWLLQESWMCPVNGEDREWANLDTLKLLESRFTEEEVQRLIDTYQDNWITEADIKRIADLDCNVIRVPFWYRNFMKDDKGTWITEDFNENPGVKRLDWVISIAEKYDMYVILDMHGCPGGQSMDHCCGTLCQNRLYTDEQCQQAMENLWSAIAERYCENPVVAAYDIMNEPQNNSGYEGEYSYDPWERESWELSNAVYDRMIKAIRLVDQKHVITVEGIWRVSNLPNPEQAGWTNMMYQVHLYDEEEGFRTWTADLAEVAQKYNVAVYVGEFQNLLGLSICNEYDVSWTTWTYKGTNKDVGTFFWYYGEPQKADCATDSYEELMEKWGAPIRTENFEEKTYVTELIQLYAKGRVQK